MKSGCKKISDEWVVGSTKEKHVMNDDEIKGMSKGYHFIYVFYSYIIYQYIRKCLK